MGEEVRVARQAKETIREIRSEPSHGMTARMLRPSLCLIIVTSRPRSSAALSRRRSLLFP
jgi:hypothetical protein